MSFFNKAPIARPTGFSIIAATKQKNKYFATAPRCSSGDTYKATTARITNTKSKPFRNMFQFRNERMLYYPTSLYFVKKFKKKDRVCINR